jgi:hypothetical protein
MARSMSPGGCVAQSPRRGRIVARQLRDVDAQDLREGVQNGVAVYFAQATLDLGERAFRPADKPSQRR